VHKVGHLPKQARSPNTTIRSICCGGETFAFLEKFNTRNHLCVEVHWSKDDCSKQQQPIVHNRSHTGLHPSKPGNQHPEIMQRQSVLNKFKRGHSAGELGQVCSDAG